MTHVDDIDRRTVLRATAIAGTAIGLPTISSAARPRKAISELRVDHLESPLAIETANPRLSWQVSGETQSRYRIIVAREAASAAAGRGDLWDSGVVPETRSFDISYAGKRLGAGDRAFWRVETWGPGGSRLVSAVATWQAGLISRADWHGNWLAAEDFDIAGDRKAGLVWVWSADSTTKGPQRFRRKFLVPDAVSEAVLQVVARDAIDSLWLNGKPLSRPAFRPGVVNSARMETVAMPVVAGENELIVIASYHPDRIPISPSGGMAAVIRLRHADGHIERTTTGKGWEVSEAASDNSADVSKTWSAVHQARSKPENDPWASGPAMLLRRRFHVAKPVARAIAYATALGGYYLHLNGGRVGRALLAPESTDFSKRALYQAYDVSSQVKIGANMVGAVVGDGWYGSTGLFVGRYDFGPAPCRFIAQIVIDYVDGTRELVVTDGAWETTRSPILASEIYDGEIYDARRAIVGWDETGGESRGWRPVELAADPMIEVTAQIAPPVRVTRTIKPVSIKTIRPGVHVVDFGQNFSGWCALSGEAQVGTELTLKYAEIVLPSGEVDQSNLRSAMARDIYTFAGKGREEYRPHFTYHGFRYVQVEGWKGSLPIDLLTGEVIRTDIAETGMFRIDSPLIQKLWQNTLWSQRSNFVGLPTDCPQRDERLGWMGDAQVFWDAASFNMDVSSFTRRFMADVRDGQSATGEFAEFNPQSSHAHMKGAPGWADAGVLLPWTSWRRYGDTGIIEENWRAMVAYAYQVLKANPDYVWRNGRGTDYGDWLALDAKEPGDPTTPKELVATAYWAHATQALAEMAEATGRKDASGDFRARLSLIKTAFQKAFVRTDGTVGNGSQTGYFLALRYDLLPPQLRRAAGNHVVADIVRRGTVLSTGFLGTPVALDVLLDLGERDLVRSLLERTQFPSWGYMVAHGATTIWERWNGDTGDVAMNSFNHYALGAIVGFFYRRLAGIDAAQPGFAQILISPDMWLGFGSVAATYDSQVGRIATSWRRRGTRAELDIEIPANSSAMLRLPAGKSARATLDGHALTPTAGNYEAALAGGHHRVLVSG